MYDRELRSKFIEDFQKQSHISTYPSEHYEQRRRFTEPKLSDIGLTESTYNAIKQEYSKAQEPKEHPVINAFWFIISISLGTGIGSTVSLEGGMLGALGGFIFAYFATRGSTSPEIPYDLECRMRKVNKYDLALNEYKIAIECRDQVNRERKEQERRRIEEKRAQERQFQRQKEKDYWLRMDPFEFEENVALCLKESRKVDWAEVTKKSGDGGVDIEARKNSQRIIIQCKAYTAPVGIKDARELLGVKIHLNAPRAILVSRSTFVSSVHSFAKDNGLELIDLDGLVQLANKTAVSFDILNFGKKKAAISEQHSIKPLDLVTAFDQAFKKQLDEWHPANLQTTKVAKEHHQTTYNKTEGKQRPSPNNSAKKPDSKGLINLGNGISMEFARIPAGSFILGSESSSKDATPVHLVEITQPFWMSKTPVTQKQFQQIMGTNPSYFKNPDNPVEQVSWHEAIEFCRKLTKKEHTSGGLPNKVEYTLPTEAQWEYACRAGAPGNVPKDSDAWWANNSLGKSHPVGNKEPNAWNLYDMQGNIWEWCLDNYDKYTSKDAKDPVCINLKSERVRRGGCWNGDIKGCHPAFRHYEEAYNKSNIVGFRVCTKNSNNLYL